jgi:hypothetical protein
MPGMQCNLSTHDMCFERGVVPSYSCTCWIVLSSLLRDCVAEVNHEYTCETVFLAYFMHFLPAKPQQH